MGVYEQNVDLYLDTTLTDTTMSRQDLLGLLLRNILSLVCLKEILPLRLADRLPGS